MKKVWYLLLALLILNIMSTNVVKAKEVKFDDVVLEMKNRLSSFQDKVSVQSNNDSMNITFTEKFDEVDEPLVINMILKLEGNNITYQFTNNIEIQEYLFVESLIRNLMLDNLIHAVGKLSGFSNEDIDDFNRNIASIKPIMDKYGIYIKNEPYVYMEQPNRDADIEIDFLIEKIDNYGKGTGEFTLVDKQPVFGYILNTNKSKCRNGSSFDISNGSDNKPVILVNIQKKDVCEVYFTVNDLFPYNLTLNTGIVDDFEISLVNFNIYYEDKIDNPKTGLILPISIINGCLVTVGVLYLIAKNRRKLFKI